MVSAPGSLLSGIVLGLVAGMSPGPVLALVIAETLKLEKREGFKVAVSPLISDSIILLLTSLGLSVFVEQSWIIGVISVFGACYLIYLGIENLRVRTSRFEVALAKKNAFRKAIITNLLNPNAYIFWLTVGSPLVLETLKADASLGVLFLMAFFTFLMGSMVLVALVVDRSKAFVQSKYYSYVVRVLGLVLILFALTILIDGLELLGSL